MRAQPILVVDPSAVHGDTATFDRHMEKLGYAVLYGDPKKVRVIGADPELFRPADADLLRNVAGFLKGLHPPFAPDAEINAAGLEALAQRIEWVTAE